jgi:hypothetical protein
MTANRREDLLDVLRKLERERQECRALAAKSYPGSTAHGHYGCADGIDFAIGEIAARFGIELEEIEEDPVPAPGQAAEAKPEKKMALSKGEVSRGRKEKSS